MAVQPGLLSHGHRPRALSLRGLLLAALFALLCAACSSNEPAPSVLLITIDTVRPDHLGFAGSARPTSPRLDRLAAEGLVFTNAYSQSGWTLPAMATILTGLYPKQHGATDFHFRMNKDLPTLAAVLATQGYDTRAYVSHTLLTREYGFDKGFRRFDSSVLDRGDPHRISTSPEVTALAVKELGDLKEPYFVWVHYFDPHFAYLAHEGWEAFGNDDPGRYDQEIAYTDRAVGQLLDAFQQRGLLEHALIVFTADHGEEFGEHGGIYHETCHEEVVRVPLVFRGPGIAPGEDATLTDQVDLVPTILARLGLAWPAELPGRDVLVGQAAAAPRTRQAHAGATAGSQAAAAKTVFIERDRPPGFRQRALLRDGVKLVFIEPRDTLLIPASSRNQYRVPNSIQAGTYVYDLQADPVETRNVADLDASRTETLLARLAAHFTGGPALPAEQVTVTEEMRERLRALGYIR